MFFIMGIDPRQKDIPYSKGVFICDRCGQYGRYEVLMTYMCFSLFFIPLIKWNKKFIVKATCCNAYYELDSEIGQALAKGDDVTILPEHLQVINGRTQQTYRRCTNCGFSTEEEYQYCPKCGKPFEN